MIWGSWLFAGLTVILIVGAITLICQARSLVYKRESAQYLCQYFEDESVNEESKDHAYRLFRVFTSPLVLVLYPLVILIVIKELFTGKKEYPKLNVKKDRNYSLMYSNLWLFLVARHPFGCTLSFALSICLLLIYFAVLFGITFISSFIVGKSLVKSDVNEGFTDLAAATEQVRQLVAELH